MFRKNLYLSCSNSVDILIGAKIKKERAQLLVNTKKIIKKPETDVEDGDQEVLRDQNYVGVLGRDVQGIVGVGMGHVILLLVAKVTLHDS